MIANVIENQFKTANDWPFGAALSFLLMYMTFVAMAVQEHAHARTQRGAGMKPRKSPPGPLEYLRAWPIRAWRKATTFYLYAPLVTLIAFSFNDSSATSCGAASPGSTTKRPSPTLTSLPPLAIP